MRKMSYSDAEILERYRKASNKINIITVLADLNVCSRNEMKDYLEHLGINRTEFEKKQRRKEGNNMEKVMIPEIVKVAVAEKIDRDEKEIAKLKSAIEKIELGNTELEHFLNTCRGK